MLKICKIPTDHGRFSITVALVAQKWLQPGHLCHTTMPAWPNKHPPSILHSFTTSFMLEDTCPGAWRGFILHLFHLFPSIPCSYDGLLDLRLPLDVDELAEVVLEVLGGNGGGNKQYKHSSSICDTAAHLRRSYWIQDRRHELLTKPAEHVLPQFGDFYFLLFYRHLVVDQRNC